MYTRAFEMNTFTPNEFSNVATLRKGALPWSTPSRMLRGTSKLLQSSKTPPKLFRSYLTFSVLFLSQSLSSTLE